MLGQPSHTEDAEPGGFVEADWYRATEGSLCEAGMDAFAAHGLAGEYRRIRIMAVRPSAKPARPLLGMGSPQMPANRSYTPTPSQRLCLSQIATGPRGSTR